jgi:hypothetical protein
MGILAKRTEIICEYQPYIDHAPVSRDQLYGKAQSNDEATVNAWRSTWIANIRANHKEFGPFSERGLGKLWGKHRNSPAIVVGSGPSLKENAAGLKDNPGIPVVSCLHNFHYLEDLGVKVDYYVTLDAGRVTIEEVSEGGSKSADEYWAMTEGKTLMAYIATDPELIRRWRGPVYFYNCAVPDKEVERVSDELEPFHTYVSTGGNVLGACTYIAKAILGSNPIVFMGANFSFSYLDRFHGWDSKYDANLGLYERATDVYGNSVKTWRSYANFKSWFDWLCQSVPGLWINCTEGGTLGAYPQGNIRAVIQMDLKDFFRMQSLCDETRDQCENPQTEVRKILF